MKSRFLALALSLLSASVILVGMPAIAPAPAKAATGIAPTAISLVASNSTATTSTPVTLTATADKTVSSTSYYMQIWRTAPGAATKITTCSSGSVCTTPVTAAAAQTSTYKAFVVDGNPTTLPTSPTAQSSEVTVERAAFSLNLSTTKSKISTSEAAPLTATSNQSVASTGLRIFIYNRTTQKIVAACSTSASCAYSAYIASEPKHNYVAYVATSVGGATASSSQVVQDTPSDLKATSSVLEIERNAFSLTLATVKGEISTDESSTVTATANQTVSGTGYRIFIYDRTSGELKTSCSTSSQCSYAATVTARPSSTYVAYVAKTVGGNYNLGVKPDAPEELQAESSTVEVKRTAWSVALNSNKTDVYTNDFLQVTATANQSVNSTGYRIFIYNSTKGAIATSCTTGKTCTLSTNQYDKTARYVAYVAKDINGSTSGQASEIPTDLKAESNRITINRYDFEVSLSASKVYLSTYEASTITVKVNQPVSSAGYKVFTYDSAAKNMTTCQPTYTDCSFTYHGRGIPSTTLRAYVATAIDGKTSGNPTDGSIEDNPENVQAQSKIAKIAGKPWTVTYAQTPQGMGYVTNQRPTGFYSIIVYDSSDNRIIRGCNVSPCVGPRGSTAYVAQSISGYSSPVPVQVPEVVKGMRASSRGYSPAEDGYSGEPLDTKAIGSANPETCVCSTADPVNLQTGALTESGTDLSVPAPGFALSQDRDYSSQHANKASVLGNGWSFLWQTKATVDPVTEAVTLTFDDWSSKTFEKTGATYAAPSWSSDQLAPRSGGGWLMSRRTGEKWLFDASGNLIRIENAEGKFLAATYAQGVVDEVTSSSGQSLDFTSANGKLTKVTSPGGKEVAYAYNSSNDLTEVTYPDDSTVEYAYDSAHRLTGITNRNGEATTNEYDGQDRVTKQTDALGQETGFAWEPGVATITRPNGRVDRKVFSQGLLMADTEGYQSDNPRTWTYAYDPVNFAVSQITDPLGNTMTNTYDVQGNRVAQTDANGKVTTWQYDGRKLVSQTLPDGTVQAISYTDNMLTGMSQPFRGAQATSSLGYTQGANSGLMNSVTDSTGRTSNFEYDARGLKTEETSPNGSKTAYAYDLDGDLQAITDAKGLVSGATASDHKVTYTRDEEGRVLTSTDQLGAVTTYTYDSQGNMLTETDATGKVKSFTYDALDRVQTQTSPDGLTTTFAYDELGNVSSVEDAVGEVTEFTHNKFGDRTKVETPEGRTVTQSYDPAGRVVKVVNGVGGEETMAYNGGGQVVAHTSATGGVTTYTYDSRSRVASMTDPNSKTTAYTYDSMGNQKKVTYQDGTSVETDYDADGRLLSRTDQNNRSVTYTPNSSGMLGKITDAANRENVITYDVTGAPKKVVRPDGLEISYTYDRTGRLLTKAYSDSTPAVAYTYDAAGRRLTMTDGTGTTTYTYDGAGRPQTIEDGNGNETSYSYNSAGRIATISYPSGLTVTRGYDKDGLLTSITDDADNETSFAYDAGGNLSKITYPNGIEQNVGRDVASQVTGVNVKKGSSALATWDYTVTAAGQVGGMSDSITGTTPTYAYSDTNRLTASVGSGYQYDFVGNIVGLPNGDSLTYDAVDQLATRSAGGNTLTTYSYDQRGNRVSEVEGASTNTFTWDAENRLTSVTKQGDPTLAYTYDGDGLRSTVTKASTTSDFVWDRSYGNPELLEDGTNAYVYGPNGIPVQQVNKATDAVSYLHVDRLGSVRMTTDEAGGQIGTASFDPYGKPQGAVTTATPFGFAGEYTDESGLQYLRARYYDPATAQFLSVDPLYASTHERYSYAGGDPLSFTDPSGLFWANDLLKSGKEGFKDAWNSSSDAISSAADSSWSYLKEHKDTIMEVGNVALIVGAGACIVITGGGCAVVLAVGAAALGAFDYASSAECINPRDLLISAGTGALMNAGIGKGLRLAGPLLKEGKIATQAGFKAGKRETGVCKVNSFSGNTPVLLASGKTKKIKKLKVGDKVWAKDPKTGKVGPRTVTDTIRSLKKQDWTKVELSDGTVIKATAHHPFWVADPGSWVDALALKPGSTVELSNGTRVQVTAVHTWTARQKAYNLTVDDLHTYYAGDSKVLVHNDDVSDPLCKINPANHYLFRPGRYAGKGTPSSSRRVSASEQRSVNAEGDDLGCHSCGAVTSGRPNGNWTGDHQSPTSLNFLNKQQFLYPHCKACSNRQGGLVAAAVKQIRKNSQ